MAKLIEYDVTNVETSAGGTGVKVKPGLKVARIVSCKQRDTKSDGSPANDLQVVLDVGEQFDWLYTYIGLGPAADWKLAEFVRACALKEKGKFDPDKVKDKLIRVKVNAGEYGGEYSPDAGKLFPAVKGDVVGPVSFSGTDSNAGEPAAADDTPADEPTSAEEEICREDPDDPEIGSYDDWPDEDLTAEVEARGLTMPGGRGTVKAKAIKALRADDEEADAGGEAEDAEAEDEAEDQSAAKGTDDYEEWTLEQLETEWTEREMGDLPSVRGRNRDQRLMAAIIEELRKDDAENPFEG